MSSQRSPTVSPIKAWAPGALVVRTGCDTGTERSSRVHQRAPSAGTDLQPTLPPAQPHGISPAPGVLPAVTPPSPMPQRQFQRSCEASGEQFWKCLCQAPRAALLPRPPSSAPLLTFLLPPHGHRDDNRPRSQPLPPAPCHSWVTLPARREAWLQLETAG